MPPLSELPPIGTAESPTLDFKVKSHIEKEGDRRELAKDVAALANALGGTLISGAVETAGGLTKYVPYEEATAERVRRAYEKAVLDYCVPAPVVMCEKRRVAPPDADAEGFIVLVRVTAYPGQPVGVRVDTGVKASYFFPVRVGADTTFYRPDQLAMLMSAEVRRAAILLNEIGAGNECVVFETLPSGRFANIRHRFAGLDEMKNAVLLQPVSKDGGPTFDRSVPLDRVKTVFFDMSAKVWSVLVD